MSIDYSYMTLKFSSSTCPENYTTLFSGSHESIYGEPLTYIEAVERCEVIGGDGLMAIPETEALKKIAQVQLENLPISSFFFVGLTRADENSEWRWTLPHLVYNSSVLDNSTETLKGAGLYASLDFTGSKAPLRVQTGGDVATGYICHFPG
ncbi:unnamed protein product [Caenorhabditis nigoni]